MADHALLSPSGATRWMACTPSARLEEFFQDAGSDFAREGTLAHAISENMLRSFFNIEGKKEEWDAEVEKLTEDPMYSETMQEYVDDYVAYIIEEYETTRAEDNGAVLFIEQKLDLRDYIPESFGTGDAIIISNRRLKIKDLKYGQGVRVSCEKNKQMMLYALGALKAFGFIYDVETVEMTIYQPRMSNISSYEMAAVDLMDWAENELKPKAEMAHKGEGEFVAGKHCTFCKVKATCKALAEENLRLAKYDFIDSFLLSDADVADILDRADMFTNWINAVKEHAFKQALNGKKWPGYKLVEGRANRKYTDEKAIADTLLDNGYPEAIIYEKSLLPISKMEKAIGKKSFGSLLEKLVYKPSGTPTLVPESDKRAEFTLKPDASEDFKDFIQ